MLALLIGALAVLPGAPGRADDAKRPVADTELRSFVEERIQDWQPTHQERLLDEVGWARDIRHALRLAREHNRPVFLFTLDGRMDIGRC